MKRLAQNPHVAGLSSFVQCGQAAADAAQAIAEFYTQLAAGDDPAQVLQALELQD